MNVTGKEPLSISGSSGNTSALNYMPQLDTLRAFAVIAVLVEHWLSDRIWLKIVPFGMLGVTLFFVLSGFLITQILLQSKVRSGNKDPGIRHLLKQFYIRRTLRIFPIYYITIFILLALNIQNISAIFPWFFFYASNIYFYLINDWAGPLSHFWTLAVEEQFYIIWPLIILLTPKKHLLKAISGIILTAMLTRAVLFLYSDQTDYNATFISILTPSCMDCFGLGAILAYYRVFSSRSFQFKGRIAVIFLLINFLSIIILLLSKESVLSMFLFKFNASVIFMLLISKVSTGFNGPLKIIFENRFLMYLGKISYGIYLFHHFIPMLYSWLKLPSISNIYIRFFIMGIFLLILSSISWYVIEKPVNNLKNKFRYD